MFNLQSASGTMRHASLLLACRTCAHSTFGLLAYVILPENVESTTNMSAFAQKLKTCNMHAVTDLEH